MSKGGYRDNRWENSVINRIDRGRHTGPKSNPFEEAGTKMRLHQCQVGMWIREIYTGKDHFGPPLRVIDPKGGVLENKRGQTTKMSPRTMVMVQS